MPKEILRGFGGDVDAVAGWLAPMAARTPPTIFREASSPQVGSLRPLDRVGPAHADLCSDFFTRAVALELSFFEAAYMT
jgi:hypothetical protein